MHSTTFNTFTEPTDHPNREESAFADSLPIFDLTAAIHAGQIPSIVEFPAAQTEEAVRALYRNSRRHLVITGVRGVGKTTFVHYLANRAAAGHPPFLQNKRFVLIDCHNVAREDSRACLESIVHLVVRQRNLVLCLDGLASLLRRPGGEDNKALLRAALCQPHLQIVGILSKWEFNDLIGGDADMSEHFTKIELDEPHGDFLNQIVQQIAVRLENDFQLKISSATVDRAISLCSSFILNGYFPQKVERILRHVCEDIDFDRTQCRAQFAGADNTRLVSIVSQSTGFPVETLSGHAEQPDFESTLADTVVGQPEAVTAVAAELRLIKAGLVDPNKPASVLLFAGMTGVGKTELAKRLAEVYSTSKRLLTYPMGNFTEPHSVSGIIGVPPGYVGHEQGGRLVNDLNADPYSVFLLDESEKAHPNIWTPFLNLFDEGWLIDQRGTKAYADRSIFVLTTNAGADTIAQMSKSGHKLEEIEDRVRQMLARIRHERSSQPVFTPQFLARIKKIVIFRTLDLPAVLGICRKLAAALQIAWLRRREKQLLIADNVLNAIASWSHFVNEKSGGKEGGRIIRKVLSESVESRIQSFAIQNPSSYKRCQTIRVELPTGQQDNQEASYNPRERPFDVFLDS